VKAGKAGQKKPATGRADAPEGALDAQGRTDTTHIFKATKREFDGKLAVEDLCLQFLVPIALRFPAPGKSGSRRITAELSGAGAETVANIWRALLKKRINTIDTHGNYKPRANARELILDLLVKRYERKPELKPYAGILAAFAEQNDLDFFEQFVRGIKDRRMDIFPPEEWFLLTNWDEWNKPFSADLPNLPPLKFWTDQAIVNFLEYWFRNYPDLFKFHLSGFRTKRTRLDLEKAKPAKVTGFFQVRGRPEDYRIEMAE